MLGMALDPAGKQLVVGTYMDPRTGRPDGRVFLTPVEGGPSRVFRTGWEGLGTFAVAFDRTGRRVLAMPAMMAYPDLHDPKLQILKVWDLDSGRERTFSLSHLVDPAWQGCSEEKLVVAPDGSLYCGGSAESSGSAPPEGLDGEVQGEIVFPDKNARLALSRDGRQALIMAGLANAQYYVELHLLDLETRTSRRITTHGNRLASRPSIRRERRS